MSGLKTNLNSLCGKGVVVHLLSEALDLAVILLEGNADLPLEAVDDYKVGEEWKNVFDLQQLALLKTGVIDRSGVGQAFSRVKILPDMRIIAVCLREVMIHVMRAVQLQEHEQSHEREPRQDASLVVDVAQAKKLWSPFGAYHHTTSAPNCYGNRVRKCQKFRGICRTTTLLTFRRLTIHGIESAGNRKEHDAVTYHD